jgi:hypothetical protein
LIGREFPGLRPQTGLPRILPVYLETRETTIARGPPCPTFPGRCVFFGSFGLLRVGPGRSACQEPLVEGAELGGHPLVTKGLGEPAAALGPEPAAQGRIGSEVDQGIGHLGDTFWGQ